MQITKSNQVLQESESKLEAEITFLKEQVTASWQNSTDDKHMANPNAILQPETSTSSEDITPRITTENGSETPKPRSQTEKTDTLPDTITPNIPTKNRFLPLQNSMNESDTLPNREDIDSTYLAVSPSHDGDMRSMRMLMKSLHMLQCLRSSQSARFSFFYYAINYWR